VVTAGTFSNTFTIPACSTTKKRFEPSPAFYKSSPEVNCKLGNAISKDCCPKALSLKVTNKNNVLATLITSRRFELRFCLQRVTILAILSTPFKFNSKLKTRNFKAIPKTGHYKGSVCSPADAIYTYLNSDLDLLTIEDYLVWMPERINS